MPLPPWITDLRSLDLLLSVAELGSVGRAAAEHHISQPSASERLNRLERQLGVELLIRTTQGSRLTPAGEAVATWAREVVSAAHAMADGVGSLRTGGVPRLAVVASLTVAEYLLPGWLLDLRRRHADATISAGVANSHDVCDAVRAGRVDLGFIESPDLPPDLHCLTVGVDRLALVTRSGDVPPTGLTVRELTRLPLLVREPGSGTRETFLRALSDALGEPPELPDATELGSTATILATARAGGGIGVISARAAASAVRSGELSELAVDGLELDRPLSAVWRGRRPPPLAAELIGIAQGTVQAAPS
ncbi:MAG: LysR family transcriptional regulator [Jatrophihabitans sp.]|uniref:LysR family transcriptional regulator n=1 Tax=Jatrophihabitans sp. TaxID=1932789 RepID=UPI003F7F939C